MISVKVGGDFKFSEKTIKKITNKNYLDGIQAIAETGVQRLMLATPVDTGKTAMSWSYRIKTEPGCTTITWLNSNLTDTGIPIAILLQYGHANQAGYYVQGIDYINPALRPIFEAMAEEAWKEVTK